MMLGAAICIPAYELLHADGNTHATVVFLGLFYAIVLPALVWDWRRNSGSAEAALNLRRWRIPAIVAFAVLSAVIGWTTDHAALITDESSYCFEARIFSAGKLKAEPLPGATENPKTTPAPINFAQTIQTPKGWLSKYPPGWPLILSLGYVLHCPWLINPILGVIQLLLISYLARPWGIQTQSLAVLMAATSAYMLVESVGFMSHASEATVCLLAIAALFRGLREGQLRWIAVAVVLVALATQIRPLTGAVLGVLCAIPVVIEFRGDRKLAGGIAILAAGAALCLGCSLLVNRIYTGDAFLSPYALIEGSRKVREVTFNPHIIIYNILNTWRWSILDTIRVIFPFFFLFAAYACWSERQHRRELLYLALFFPLLVLAYCLHSEGSSSFDGERYYFEGVGMLTLVAARGFLLLASRWKVTRTRVLTTLLTLMSVQLAMLVSAIPDIESRAVLYRQAYRLATASPRRALVFIGGYSERFTSTHTNWNTADWRSAPIVYLNDPGPADRSPYACLLGRSAYRVVDYRPDSNSFFVSDLLADCSPFASTPPQP
jgi:hypothetical protein